MWDDSGACEPERARARDYPCCKALAPGESECDHAFLHTPALVPRWSDQELLFDVMPPDGEDEGETWFFAVHGTLRRKQPGPLKGWVDAWVTRIDGFGFGLTISEDDCPDDERDELVQEFLITREVPGRRLDAAHVHWSPPARPAVPPSGKGPPTVVRRPLAASG